MTNALKIIDRLVIPFTYAKSLINKGHTRSIKAKKNIIASFIIRGISIAVSLVLVPLTINYLNTSRYGIWLTLSSIVGWFSFFDIGLGNGLRNKFAEAIAKGDHKIARTYVSTTYAILSIISTLVLIIFFVVNPFLNWSKILNAPANMASELSILALIVFVFFCLQFVLQLIVTILTANQNPAIASFLNLMGNLFSLVVIFILSKKTSGNLIYLGITFGSIPVFILFSSSFWFYRNKYKKYAPSVKYIQFNYAKNIMNLGFKFFVIQVAMIVLYESSNIIISQLFGPNLVTTYNISYKYFGIIPMFFSIITMPFWSAFTDAWVKKDFQWIKNIIQKLNVMWLLLALLAIIMVIFSNTVYRTWVGKKIEIPISLSIVIATYVIINAWNGIYSLFLNGVGKIKLQFYSAIFGMSLNIPMSLFLGKTLGIAGVILSSVILSVINMFWTRLQYIKIINNTAKGIWAK